MSRPPLSTSFVLLSLAAVLAGGSSCGARPVPTAAVVRVAAAADLRYALEEIVSIFAGRHPGLSVTATYGSSGTFYSQLTNGAPFDVFLSADVEYPKQLVSKGLTLDGDVFDYGVGRLVLWVPTASPLDLEHDRLRALSYPSVQHIAIANPAHAPYGRAAEAALASAGLLDAVRSKLVLGENVSQAFQFAQSGAAEVGLVALSLARSPQAGGRFIEPPAGSYPPLIQGGTILKSAAAPDAARAFVAYLTSDEGRAVLARWGFGPPEK